jgi:hypothetical protein
MTLIWKYTNSTLISIPAFNAPSQKSLMGLFFVLIILSNFKSISFVWFSNIAFIIMIDFIESMMSFM